MQRRTAAEAGFLKRERAEVALNSIGDGVISTDLDGTVTSLNAVAERMTGWTTQDAAGRPLSEVFHIIDATTRLLAICNSITSVRCAERLRTGASTAPYVNILNLTGTLAGSPITGNPSTIFSTAARAVSSFARTYRMNVCAECPMIFAPVPCTRPVGCRPIRVDVGAHRLDQRACFARRRRLIAAEIKRRHCVRSATAVTLPMRKPIRQRLSLLQRMVVIRTLSFDYETLGLRQNCPR